MCAPHENRGFSLDTGREMTPRPAELSQREPGVSESDRCSKTLRRVKANTFVESEHVGAHGNADMQRRRRRQAAAGGGGGTQMTLTQPSLTFQPPHINGDHRLPATDMLRSLQRLLSTKGPAHAGRSPVTPYEHVSGQKHFFRILVSRSIEIEKSVFIIKVQLGRPATIKASDSFTVLDLPHTHKHTRSQGQTEVGR